MLFLIEEEDHSPLKLHLFTHFFNLLYSTITSMMMMMMMIENPIIICQLHHQTHSLSHINNSPLFKQLSINPLSLLKLTKLGNLSKPLQLIIPSHLNPSLIPFSLTYPLFPTTFSISKELLLQPSFSSKNTPISLNSILFIPSFFL